MSEFLLRVLALVLFVLLLILPTILERKALERHNR
jgi:hypothetical protein